MAINLEIQAQTVTIRPPNLTSDPRKMRDLLIANKYNALPGFEDHNLKRIRYWQLRGTEFFHKIIENSIEQPDRHFVRVAAIGSRVIGYARGYVLDTQELKVPDWIFYNPTILCGRDRKYITKPLGHADCANFCAGLMVDPEYWGMGLGRHLAINRLALMMRQLTKFYAVRSHVPETNFASIAFHASLGLFPVDSLEPIEDMPAKMLVMQLDTSSHTPGWFTDYSASNWHLGETHEFQLRNRNSSAA